MGCVGEDKKQKEKNQGCVKDLVQATERIVFPSTQIGKAVVGRVLGKKMRCSVLEVKFEESRPPSGDNIE